VHPDVKAKDGLVLIDWLTSPEGQKTIADYQVGREHFIFP
jgi:tungstate transport system substrate-binding protein